MGALRHKRLVYSMFTLFFVSLLALCVVAYQVINAPIIPVNSPPMVITLDRSATANQFVNQLKDQKLIHTTRFLLMIIRYEGLSHRLKAGVYQIKPGETALQLLHRVVSGDVLIQNFIIIEGTTQEKVAQDLKKAPYLEYNPLDWLLVKGTYPSAEGLLLADTYQYVGGSTSKTLLVQAHRNLMDYLNKCWTSRSPDLPYKNAYELLVAASIIEKETAISQERNLVSGVLVNRLKKKMPLQMDPTVIYGLGANYKGKLSHNDLLINSPYNSYLNRGLPPTPIAMVGKEALDAAAHPLLSNYLYYVAKGDGSHQFSETYEQQKQAIKHYQRKGF